MRLIVTLSAPALRFSREPDSPLADGRKFRHLDRCEPEAPPELAQLVDNRPGHEHRRVWVTPDLTGDDLLARLLASNLDGPLEIILNRVALPQEGC